MVVGTTDFLAFFFFTTGTAAAGAAGSGFVLGTGNSDTTGVTEAEESEAVSTIFAEYAWGRALGSAARAEGATMARLANPMRPASEVSGRAEFEIRRNVEGFAGCVCWDRPDEHDEPDEPDECDECDECDAFGVTDVDELALLNTAGLAVWLRKATSCRLVWPNSHRGQPGGNSNDQVSAGELAELSVVRTCSREQPGCVERDLFGGGMFNEDGLTATGGGGSC